MYYRKNKSIIRSIKNNKNTKAYYALVVVMLAAIAIIAASVILNGQSGKDSKVPPSDGAYENPETTASAEQSAPVGESGNTESPAFNEPEEHKNPSGYPPSQYAAAVLMEECLVVVCELDAQGEYSVLRAVTKGAAGEDIALLLGKKDSLCLSNPAAAGSKAIWKSYDMDDTEGFVQYFSQINGIAFHSAIYSEYGNAYSILPESYGVITGEGVGTGGVTMTALGSKWLYENVPGDADIYLCRNLQSVPFKALEGINNEGLYELLLEKDYTVNGKLLMIPEGFHSDPTDLSANDVYCPYELGEIKNVADKTYEAGQVAYSFAEEFSTLPEYFFDDVALLDINGKDITQYLIIEMDSSVYTPEQLAAMNRNGFLVPGDYSVEFYAADLFGNVLRQTAYMHVVDTTAPDLRFAEGVSEINREQLENPDYITGLVTVTDLCQLASDRPDYTLEEADGRVIIHYSIGDVHGNIGTLEVELEVREQE